MSFDHLGKVIEDPRKNDLPKDSDLWLALLERAAVYDYELYSALIYYRAHGTVIEKDKRWGYRLKPIIGNDKYLTWKNMDEYNEYRQDLAKHGQWIIKTLKDLIAVF